MRAADAPILEIRDLCFAYGENRVLNGIDLVIPRGKVVGIMGASGCGKTTLLRLIGGQLRPTRGTVRFEGQVVHDLDQDALYRLRRDIGMLFQQGALFTDISVYDNIAFPLREHTDVPEALIRDLVLMKLHAVGLRNARDLMPNELSGGMARRVALARAIAMDPKLVIYDEPFAGLDPISLGVIANLIRTLNDALGLTSIVVTYDLFESFKIVDEVYFIANGRIVGGGTPEAMRATTEPFIHQFVHSEVDGPVPFHHPALPLAEDFGLVP